MPYRTKTSPEPLAKQRRVRDPFPITKYKEEKRQETSLIYDGVYELMHEACYVDHFGKKKMETFNKPIPNLRKCTLLLRSLKEV